MAASIRRGLMSWRCAIITRPRCCPFALRACRSFRSFISGPPEEGRSLARSLGSDAAVLMRHHGATVVGSDLRELVSRSIFMCQNAIYQLQAHVLGKVVPLTQGET